MKTWVIEHKKLLADAIKAMLERKDFRRSAPMTVSPAVPVQHAYSDADSKKQCMASRCRKKVEKPAGTG